MTQRTKTIKRTLAPKTKDIAESNGIDKLIQAKIVYWGPGESGKTTNFKEIKKKFSIKRISRGYSVETSSGRTLWQDALHFSFDFTLEEEKCHFVVQLITCTGQERFLSTREYVLDGADGVVFVGDSDPDKMEENKRSFRELMSFIGKREVPHVVQLNKRDLTNAVPMERFKRQLGLPLKKTYLDGSLVVYPAVALTGENVIECFQDLTLQIISKYFKTLR